MSDQYPQDPSQEQYGQQQSGQPQYGQQPQPAFQSSATPISPQDERTWGALSHAGALVAMICSAGFLGFVASAVVYMLYKDRGPFVRAHAANSLNVQITMFIWLAGLTVATFTIGILTLGLALIVIVPMFVAAFVVAGILHAVGAVKAYQGEWWSPPLTPRFIK